MAEAEADADEDAGSLVRSPSPPQSLPPRVLKALKAGDTGGIADKDMDDGVKGGDRNAGGRKSTIPPSRQLFHCSVYVCVWLSLWL